MPLGRMYRPSGEALETARVVMGEQDPFAVNVAVGCSNKCPTCYGPLAYKKKDWDNVRVADIKNLGWISTDIIKKQPKGVFMCFGTDPYLDCNAMNTQLIGDELITQNVKVAVLSHLVDKVKLSFANSPKKEKDLRFEGRTIVSFDEDYRKVYEPNCPPAKDRLADLKSAPYHRWISCEPYPCPAVHEQDTYKFLETLVECKPELIIFGKLNYDKRSSTPEAREFYRSTIQTFIDVCLPLGIRLHIKSDTLKFIRGK